MHGLPDLVVPPECERQVGNPSGSLGSVQVLMYPPDCLYEIDSISGMFFYPGAYRQHIGIEDYFLGRYPGSSKQPVCPGAYLDFSLECGGLSLLVESHDDHRGTEAAYCESLVDECLFAFFQAYGIDDAFSLGILQPCKYGFPVGRVDHQGRFSRCRVIGYVAAEPFHFQCAVQHRVIHIYVYDRCPVFDLVCSDLQGRSVVS